MISAVVTLYATSPGSVYEKGIEEHLHDAGLWSLEVSLQRRTGVLICREIPILV